MALFIFFGHGGQQAQANEVLCWKAIKGFKPFWNFATEATRSSVNEAKRLGFSDRECARLTGRFSEREIRAASAKKSIEDPVKSNKARPKSNTSRPVTNERAIIILTTQVNSLKAQLKKQNQVYNSLKRKTEAAFNSVKNLQNKGGDQEAHKLLNKEIQTKLNKFYRTFNEIEEKYR